MSSRDPLELTLIDMRRAQCTATMELICCRVKLISQWHLLHNDYGGAYQHSLPLFFLPPVQHKQHLKVLDRKTTVIIVQALIISRLDYCNSLPCYTLFIAFHRIPHKV